MESSVNSDAWGEVARAALLVPSDTRQKRASGGLGGDRWKMIVAMTTRALQLDHPTTASLVRGAPRCGLELPNDDTAGCALGFLSFCLRFIYFFSLCQLFFVRFNPLVRRRPGIAFALARTFFGGEVAGFPLAVAPGGSRL